MKINNDHSIIESFASKEYVTLNTRSSVSHIQGLDEREKVFSFSDYETQNRSPIKVLPVELEASKRCLDMPIRLSGESEYRLPVDWDDLKEPLERLISIEHLHNPNWKDYYTYLTVDVKDVTVGDQQRHGGLHVDGFQGTRMDPKTKITRNYVATTNGGTEFWNQPFKVLDPEIFNIFEGFDLQKESIPIIADENYFYFMDAYMVHQSGFARFNGERIFMRLTYDLKEFDRLGNTHNPNLNYDLEMVERNVWNTVKSPTINDLKNSI